MNAPNRLATNKTHKLVWQLAIPCLLAQFVNVRKNAYSNHTLANVQNIKKAYRLSADKPISKLNLIE